MEQTRKWSTPYPLKEPYSLGKMQGDMVLFLILHVIALAGQSHKNFARELAGARRTRRSVFQKSLYTKFHVVNGLSRISIIFYAIALLLWL